MKKLLLVLLFIVPVALFAQDYYVTAVGGNIFRGNKIKVQVGDKITGKEKIILTAKENFLIILSTTGSRFRVTLNNKQNQSSSELLNFFLSENMHVHADNVRLSSKSTGDEIDLADYFKPVVVNGKEINDKILITDGLKIPVGKMGYRKTDNAENFFFLQFIDSSGKGVNKKLEVRDDTLLISREDLTFKGKLYTVSDGVLKLGFVKGYSTEKKIIPVADIKPSYISKTELYKMIQAIKLAMAADSKDERLKEIYTELYYIYGKPDRQLIESLYD
jgi:hypothetical protein